jgi:V/A-type H+-transporting ATPase subunit D
MPLRVPPGRSGRPWLRHRLELAHRGAELLEHKRHALEREVRRTETLVRTAREEWESRAREAELWLNRAALLAGERQLRRAGAAAKAPPELRIQWRRSLAVHYPHLAEITFPPAPNLAALGGTSAIIYALQAHRRACEAALSYAAAKEASERFTEELRATVRRLRATEKRWIPLHEQALANLEVALDEIEREDAARTRWVVRRLAVAPNREYVDRGS